jgi:N-acyl-D-amino-acid deacylase
MGSSFGLWQSSVPTAARLWNQPASIVSLRGAYPRFLGRLRREFPTVTLEGMVHRMTDRPAQRFGITKRGRIQKGYYADITSSTPTAS